MEIEAGLRSDWVLSECGVLYCWGIIVVDCNVRQIDIQLFTCPSGCKNLAPKIYGCCASASLINAKQFNRVPIKINFVGSSLAECMLVRVRSTRDFFLH